MNIKKILSLSLSGLLFANSFCMTPYAIDNNNNTVPPAPKSANALDIIKNNPKTSAGIAGGSLLAAGVLGALGYLIYKCATDVPQDYLYKKLTEPISPVTADDWFYRLGGTQQDIDDYYSLANWFDSNSATIEFKSMSTLENDIPRGYHHIVTPDSPQYVPAAYDSTGRGTRNLDSNPYYYSIRKSVTRILKIYYGTHTDVTYEQGWDYTMYMIYLKFVREKPNHDVLMPKEEAQVYFIYTKFMKMLNAKFGTDTPDYEPWSEYCSNYMRYQNNSNTDAHISRNINNIQGNSLAPFFIFKRGIFSAGATLFISYGNRDSSDEIIRIWDKIIMDDRFISSYKKNFDTNAVLENLNFIIYSYLASNKYPSFMNNVIPPQ